MTRIAGTAGLVLAGCLGLLGCGDAVDRGAQIDRICARMDTCKADARDQTTYREVYAAGCGEHPIPKFWDPVDVECVATIYDRAPCAVLADHIADRWNMGPGDPATAAAEQACD